MAAVEQAFGQISVSELKNLDLEELVEVEVTSVSRRPEPIYATAGAVSVLTGREIAQTGATAIADALRYVPGVQSARADSRTWAVSVRGFNGLNANKLLVLMDGRTVYTPLLSGVLWDVQDTFLPDIDRIEVVRGPGATLWGSNAVNGVISIRTKDARYTQGGLVTAGGGTEERAFASVRYGGEVPGKFYYRVYAKSAQRDDLYSPSGGENQDWRIAQTGFRIDSAMPPESGSFTIQGDYYDASVGTAAGGRAPSSGGNILVRGTRNLDDNLTLTSQVYFDHIERELDGQYAEVRHTYDFDSHINYRPFENHDIVAGVNYRSSSDHTRQVGTINFRPLERRIETYGAFVQDEIRWNEGRYGLVIGSKFEHHESVGLEVQPSLRGAVRIGRNTYWASVSRAVRTPSRYDEDSVLPNATRPINLGSRRFKSETVLAYEVGYRGQPLPELTWDVSLFYNRYDRLRSNESIHPTGFPRPPRVIGNKLNADTYGGEVSIQWRPISRLRLYASQSYLHEEFFFDPDSRDGAVAGSAEANDPKHQASLRAVLELPRQIECTLGVRYVSALNFLETRAYVAVDTKLLWRITSQWEVALVGQNLVDPQHPEYGNFGAREVQRSFYGSVTWQF